MATVNFQESGDLARLRWTLESGSSPMKRICSTLKHLRSTLGNAEIERMVTEQVKAGQLIQEPHPLHEGEYFYRLPMKE